MVQAQVVVIPEAKINRLEKYDKNLIVTPQQKFTHVLIEVNSEKRPNLEYKDAYDFWQPMEFTKTNQKYTATLKLDEALHQLTLTNMQGITKIRLLLQ